MRTMHEILDRTEANTRDMAMAQDMLAEQLSRLLSINVTQLAVQREQLTVGQHQLHVQGQIRQLNEQQLAVSEKHLAVSEKQLVQAMQMVRKLDLTNHRLAHIDTSLADISGLLVQQNALIQKSLSPLAVEAQELIQRGLEAFGNEWYEDAIADFSLAIQKCPYSALAHYFVSKCHQHEGRPLEATKSYHKCVFYARKNSPLFHCLSLCDLASQASQEKRPADAQLAIKKAMECTEQDKPVLACTLLQCDFAEQTLSSRTSHFILSAFSDENVDPEVMLEILAAKVGGLANGKLRVQLNGEMTKWEEAAQNALYDRLISHFYRELDDFVYLAPRIRKGFMEAAKGKFLSLGGPLADLLDWTAMIGDQVIRRIDLFPREYPAVLRFYRPLQSWNAILVRLNKLVSQLSSKGALVHGQFVDKLNLGMVELPKMYEDDTVLFEVNTDDGDILALTCYYAIFTRNGVDHFAVPLHEFLVLQIETYQYTQSSKGVLVVDPRTGQTLIQGDTGYFEWKDDTEKQFLIDSFIEVASLLAQVHECIQWVIAHEEECFSIFLLLHAVTDRLLGQQADHQSPSGYATLSAQPMASNADDEFEVVEEEGSQPSRSQRSDDDFEVVEDDSPDQWFINRNKKQYGPVSWKEIQNMASKGKLKPSDMLLQEGTKSWSKANGFPGLFES